MKNSFIFDGMNSSDFGVWISGTGTYTAPERDVQYVSVPGRNGDLIIDNGRWRNVPLTYPAYIESDFPDKADRFKNMMCRKTGYRTLEDSYHPDEYRMAQFTGGFEPTTGQLNRDASFDINFNCKPQRFLKSGTVPMQFIPDYMYGPGLQFSTFYFPVYNQADLTFTVHCKSTDTPTIKVDHCDSNRDVLRTSTFTTSDGYSNTVTFQNDVAYWRMYCTNGATVYNEMNVNVKTVTVYDNKPLAIDAVWCRYVKISNPTGYRAMPLIEIYANLVSQFKIYNDLNGERLSHFYFYSLEKIPDVTHFYMDCELQYMYDDQGNNLTNYLHIEDGETGWHESLVFPFFEGDEIKINWEHYDYQGLELAGLGLVTVYPRWWKL